MTQPRAWPQYLDIRDEVVLAPNDASVRSSLSDRAPVRFLTYAWAFPNTLVGLALVPAALTSNGGVRIVHGVLEIHGPAIDWILRHVVPIRGGAAAITFGHIVAGRNAEMLDLTRTHERVHVRQCEVWGPAFIPAYLLAGVWAWMHGGGAYEDNYFERQAQAADVTM